MSTNKIIEIQYEGYVLMVNMLRFKYLVYTFFTFLHLFNVWPHFTLIFILNYNYYAVSNCIYKFKHIIFTHYYY